MASRSQASSPTRRRPASLPFLERAAERARALGIPVRTISAAGRPAMWHVHGAKATVTEYRVGTYVYFDRSSVAVGAATLEDVALDRAHDSRQPSGPRPRDPRLGLEGADDRPGSRSWLRPDRRGSALDARPALRGARPRRARLRATASRSASECTSSRTTSARCRTSSRRRGSSAAARWSTGGRSTHAAARSEIPVVTPEALVVGRLLADLYPNELRDAALRDPHGSRSFVGRLRGNVSTRSPGSGCSTGPGPRGRRRPRRVHSAGSSHGEGVDVSWCDRPALPDGARPSARPGRRTTSRFCTTGPDLPRLGGVVRRLRPSARQAAIPWSAGHGDRASRAPRAADVCLAIAEARAARDAGRSSISTGGRCSGTDRRRSGHSRGALPAARRRW